MQERTCIRSLLLCDRTPHQDISDRLVPIGRKDPVGIYVSCHRAFWLFLSRPTFPKMRSFAPILLAAASSVAAFDYSQLAASKDNYGAPVRYLKRACIYKYLLYKQNPDTVYPGFESENPVVIAGSKSFQKSPPKYPSPWIEGLGDWGPAYDKARAFVSQLTLAEKVNLTTGKLTIC